MSTRQIELWRKRLRTILDELRVEVEKLYERNQMFLAQLEEIKKSIDDLLVVLYESSAQPEKLLNEVKRLKARLRDVKSQLELGESQLFEIRKAWPEVASLAERVAKGQRLEGLEEKNFKELTKATGWDEADLREELARLGEDPSESIERYKELFEKYSQEAMELFRQGDTRQAAEKMWGAVVALVKLYAAIKGVFVAHWSRSKIDCVIASNVEPEYRKLFRELVDRAHVLHEHFYEGSLNEKLFRERWDEMLELLKEAKEVVYKRLPQ
jgi:predicted  nucleic acid-binding Zn-ribbon protein